MLRSVTEEFKKRYIEKLKKYDCIVLILGPDFKKKTDGAILRNALKAELQKHITNNLGKGNKFEVDFPEESDGKPDPVTIDAVKMLMLDNTIKLIFGVWEKDAVGLIPEVHCIAEHKNISLKAKIFVDEKLWEKGAYIIHRNNLKKLHWVFNGVYPEDFKDVKNITNKAIKIFDGYCKWAMDHDDEWLGDEDQFEI